MSCIHEWSILHAVRLSEEPVLICFALVVNFTHKTPVGHVIICLEFVVCLNNQINNWKFKRCGLDPLCIEFPERTSVQPFDMQNPSTSACSMLVQIVGGSGQI